MDFCRNSGYWFWSHIRSSVAGFQDDCDTCGSRTCLSLLPDDFPGCRHCHGFFVRALVIGFGSLWLGRKVYCPMTVLYIPALLPMIPGKFAYNMVFSLIMSLQTMNEPERLGKYMETFFSNGLVTCTVIFMLAVGATFPMFLLPHKAFSLTRH